MRAANTSWQMRAARLQVNRQTKCRQKGTGGKTAIRHISAANSRPLRQYTFARIFSYTENKISGMQPLYSRRLRHAAALLPAPPAPAITLHTPSYRRPPLTNITHPASLFPKTLPALHQLQLPSSAFRNPKMHPHQ